MRLIASLLLAALLAGCIPIGIRGGTMPYRSSASESQPAAAPRSEVSA